MAKKVTNTGKDKDRDILSLCNPVAGWRVAKSQAVREIESAGNSNSPYYVNYLGQVVKVHVYKNQYGKYLRTDPDKTTRNNLAELPDC